MAKIVSKRGRQDKEEPRIDIDLDELAGETIVVASADATEDGQLGFGCYQEGWVIQCGFIRRMYEAGCTVVRDAHRQTWSVYLNDTCLATVTDTAVQSDSDTVVGYVHDMIQHITA